MTETNPTLSFEVFPPNSQVGGDNLTDTLDQLLYADRRYQC